MKKKAEKWAIKELLKYRLSDKYALDYAIKWEEKFKDFVLFGKLDL